MIRALQDFAEDLLRDENETYKQKHQSGSSQSFYNTVITSGTLSDKISALTLAVQRLAYPQQEGARKPYCPCQRSAAAPKLSMYFEL